METHQYLSNFSHDDVVEFSNSTITKIEKLKNLIISFFEDKNLVEQQIKKYLDENNLKIDSCSPLYNGYSGRYGGRHISGYFNCWFDEGVECSILQMGSQKWVKGKIKIKVNIDFYPDEPIEDSLTDPPSILDDIRQTINHVVRTKQWKIISIYLIFLMMM